MAKNVRPARAILLPDALLATASYPIVTFPAPPRCVPDPLKGSWLFTLHAFINFPSSGLRGDHGSIGSVLLDAGGANASAYFQSGNSSVSAGRVPSMNSYTIFRKCVVHAVIVAPAADSRASNRLHISADFSHFTRWHLRRLKIANEAQ